MPPSHCDNDVALPHVSFLSYFRHPATPQKYENQAKSSPTPRAALPCFDIKYKHLDEEEQCGFWDLESLSDTGSEPSSCDSSNSHRSVFHSMCDFWSFICIVSLASCAVLFGLDLVSARYGMSMSLPPPPMGHELHFCLTTPNREAPGSQIWRLMPSRSYEPCTTEMVTLLVSPSEAWKLYEDDEIALGDKQHLQADTVHIGFFGSDDMLRHDDLGDNLAEEGVLSQHVEET